MAFGSFNQTLALLITADGKGAVREIENVGRAADKDLTRAGDTSERMAGQFVRAGAVMVGAAAVVGVGLYKTAQAASALGEQANYASKVFSGEALSSVREFAKGAAESVGQSERAALQATATFGVFFNKLGVGKQVAADMSIEMVTLASDLASIADTTPEEAVLALSSALRGEMEPIRRYGVTLDDATLKQRALDMGLIKTATGTLPQSIKVQAAYAEILDQTAFAQGDFADTADGMANTQRRLTAAMENFTAAIGTGVVPVVEFLTGALTGLVSGLGAVDEVAGGAVGQFATFATIGIGAAGTLALIAGGSIKAFNAIRALNEEHPRLVTGIRGLGLAGAVGGAVAGLFALADAAGLLPSKFELAAEKVQLLARATDQQLVRAFEALRAGASAGIVDGLNTELEVFERIAKESIGTAKRLRDQLAANGEETAKYDRVLRREAQAQQQAKADTEAATEAIDEQGATAEETAESLEDLIQKVTDLAGAQLDLEEAGYRVEDAATALAEAYEKGDPSEIARKTTDYKQALIDAGQAVYDKALQENAALDPQLAQGKATLAQIQHLQELAGTMEPGSPLRVFLEQYVAQLQGAGGTFLAHLQIDPSGAYHTLFEVGEAVRGLGAGIISSLSHAFGGARAAGGPVEAGKAYRVGEEGEEWFVPEQNGTIIPHGQVKAAERGFASTSMASAAGHRVEQHFHVNVQGSVITDRDLDEVVAQALARWQRHNVGVRL